MARNTFARVAAYSALINAAAGYHWPSPQFDQLEGFLYEGGQPDAGDHNIIPSLNKCVPDTDGRLVAAEWLRFAYHDMSTHNVDDGTGGLDGSLFFEEELDRPENIGAGMRTTAIDFSGFANKYISRSDIIAVGTIIAIAECNGPSLTFRGGRIDALAAGPPGVPQPQEPLSSHIESFRRQGFTQTEMIGLVACGHTLGSIRFPDFPEIVPASADGSEVFELFDGTPAFDNIVVTEYLNGTTANPLVVNPNTTITSDLRIFLSDQNVTMQSMASATAYQNTCKSLLERMLDTVPANVTLTDPIEFQPVKVAGVQLSVPGNETLSLSASLRITGFDPRSSVRLLWADRDSNTCSQPSCSAAFTNVSDVTTTLTTRLGFSPLKYLFNAPINATTSISKFWFEVTEPGKATVVLDNGGTGYVIEQDRILFVPERSSPGTDYTIIVAARSDILPSRVYANSLQREATPDGIPIQRTLEFAIDAAIPPVLGYTFYSASLPGFQPTFDLFSIVNGTTYYSDMRDTLFIVA